MDIRRILCPLDFSDVSAHALQQAGDLARWYRARLTVLHVRPTVTPHPDMPPGGPMAPWLVAELEALRTQTAEACREVASAGVEVDIVVSAGNPVPAILDSASALPADLIVMGTHGTSGFQHLVLGSITEKVLRKAACPVLTVPPRAHTATRFTRVICAVDFSDCSLQAAAFAASVATEAGAALTLLHVVEWPWHEADLPLMDGVPAAPAIAEYRRYLELGAQERLEALAATSLPNGTAATSIRFGKPYREVLDAARDAGADLIVLGVRGRGVVDLGFFGSTANHVVRSAQCPVLTVPA